MLIFLAALVISFLVPIVMPVIALVFIGSGLKMCRDANDNQKRGFAVLVLISGLVLAFLCVAILLNLGAYDASNNVVTDGVQNINP
jgi:cytochrome c biogenesis protein CcdA